MGCKSRPGARMGGLIHSLLASVAVLGCCLTLGEAGNLRVTRELQGGTVTCNPKEFEGEGFTGCKVLDEEHMALHWKADDDGKNIKFGVMAPAASWVAVGLPREGSGLTGADVIVLKEDKAASHTVFPAPPGFWPGDASFASLPTPNPEPNTLTTHKTANGSSYFVWTRAITPCPGAVLPPKQMSRVLWTTGKLSTWQVDELPLLGPPGYTSEVLTKGAIYHPLESLTIKATFNRAQVTAPGVSFCALVEVPGDAKYHVFDATWLNTSFAGVAEAGLYDCNLQSTLEHPPGTPWVCTEELSLGRCPAVAHYVPGSGVLPGTPVLLETVDAAYPVGLGYSKYLVLSVTYGEVPTENGGVDKSSGFSLLLSKNLRANDIGVLVTGAPYTNRNDGVVTNNGIVSSLKVPMKVDEVDYVNSCPSSCVGKLIPAGAKMIASRMVLRKYGIAGLVETVTDGGAKTTLHYSRAYDPKQPGMQLFMTPTELSARQSIVTTCVYNSKNMTQDTPWGLDLQCLATIYYIYPRQDKPVGGSCFNTLGSTLPSNLAQYKDKDVALCTVGKERSFAASTAAESANLVEGVKKNAFTTKAISVRNQPAVCAK